MHARKTVAAANRAAGARKRCGMKRRAQCRHALINCLCTGGNGGKRAGKNVYPGGSLIHLRQHPVSITHGPQLALMTLSQSNGILCSQHRMGARLGLQPNRRRSHLAIVRRGGRPIRPKARRGRRRPPWAAATGVRRGSRRGQGRRKGVRHWGMEQKTWRSRTDETTGAGARRVTRCGPHE